MANSAAFSVERVEDGLDQQQVHAAVEQAPRLLVVGRLELPHS